MERLSRNPRLTSSALMWAVVLGMLMQFWLAPAVEATSRSGGYARGYTETDNDPTLTCSAEVVLVSMESVLEVDEGDDVAYTFSIYWWDNRTGASLPQAHHLFYISSTYPTRNPQAVQKNVYTYGSTSSSDLLTLTWPDVDENVRVYVTWYASINVNYGDCTDSDYVSEYHDYN